MHLRTNASPQSFYPQPLSDEAERGGTWEQAAMTGRTRSTSLLLWLAPLALAGCAQLHIPKDHPWPWQADDRVQAPVKVVAMWTDTVAYQPSLTPQRGFGGRLMFYGPKSEKPVRVDGTLVVYAFDESKSEKDGTKPDRKYVFTPEQFKLHYSKSQIGHSYSIWLPWDEAGGQQCEISLIVRFTPAEGSIVVSEQTTQILGGTDKDQGLAQRSSAPAETAGAAPGTSPTVRQVSYEEAAISRGTQQRAPSGEMEAQGSSEGGSAKLQTSTITMPSRSNLKASRTITPARTTRLPSEAAPTAGLARQAPEATALLAPSTPAPAAAVAPPASVTTPPTRSGFSRHRALGEPIARPRDDHAP